jgi:hypothetical protein
MKKILQLTVLALLFGFSATAQDAALKGLVKSNSNPVKNITVSLFHAKDSLLTKVSVTNESGNYEFENIKPGSYFLQFSNIGYQTKYQPVTVQEGQRMELDPVTLAVAVKTSSTVNVKAKKPLIEVKADKMVFNVENSINAIGSSAFELLRKSPGVVIDKDDNLILKGKNGVRIYIDGKPTPFTGKDLAAYLKNINSADIEAIELITNPSARYDAAGNAGIINIKLKKSKKLGYNGSMNLGFAQGITPKLNSSITMNYKKDKWNVFGNYSNNFGKNQANFNFYREQLDSIFDQKTVMINDDKSHNFKAGADFSSDKNNTWGVVVTGGINRSGFESNSTSPIFNLTTKQLGSTLRASNDQHIKRDNLNLNLNYRYTDTTGVEVGADIDRAWFQNAGDSYQPNEYRYTSNLNNPVYKIYRNITPTDIKITSAKLDIAVPYKKGKLEIGGKYANVITENASDFYNVINGVNKIDIGRTNKFSYKENINALYANYNRPLNAKWTIQAGVRMENTSSEGILTSSNPQPDDKIKRNYNNMFNLTYSRRIDRPGYQDLNPFEYKIDELTYQKGNAFLKPQYANVVELTHTFKYRYNTTLSFTHTKDFSSQIIENDGYKTFVTQKNLATQDVAGINFSAPVQLNKWWSIFGNVNLNYTKYNASFPNGNKINTSVASGSFFAQNTFSLDKGFNIEASGFYQLPTIWGGTFQSTGIGGMDIGISSPIFKNNATIRFSYSDLLHTMKFKGVSNYGGMYFVASGRWESQQFKMNFNWRFGNKNLRGNREKKSGNEEELKRTKKSSTGFGG